MRLIFSVYFRVARVARSLLRRLWIPFFPIFWIFPTSTILAVMAGIVGSVHLKMESTKFLYSNIITLRMIMYAKVPTTNSFKNSGKVLLSATCDAGNFEQSTAMLLVKLVIATCDASNFERSSSVLLTILSSRFRRVIISFWFFWRKLIVARNPINERPRPILPIKNIQNIWNRGSIF